MPTHSTVQGTAKWKWLSICLKNGKLGANKKLQMEGSFSFKDGVSFYCHRPETSLLSGRALLEPHSLSSKSRPAPVCGQMVLWSRFLRDPALSAHHLLFPTKHMAAENLSPIHCSPLPSPNTLVFQPVPICCYFLLLVHFSSSILLQPCLTAWSNILCL